MDISMTKVPELQSVTSSRGKFCAILRCQRLSEITPVANFLDVMHIIKGGWVGQTFALAKSNESEGRKSRIRRSKEERKAMVESFIKKYQKLNNGNFPSLNLTHKEVGGSFYTVREIVRDVIQENRVLGPAKLTRDEQITNQLEEEPLGSIAIGPSLTISNDLQLVKNEHQGGSEGTSSVSDGCRAKGEQQIFDNGKVINATLADKKNEGLVELSDREMQAPELAEVEQNVDNSVEEADIVFHGHYDSREREIVEDELIVNGIQVDVGKNESDELAQSELQMSEPSEADNVEEELAASRSKVTPIAENVIVETFPLSSVTSPSKMDGRLSEVNGMVNTFTEQGINKAESAARVGSFQTERTNSSEKSSLMDDKEVTRISSALLDKNSGLMDEKPLEKHQDPLLESSNCCNDVGKHESQDFANGAVKVSSDDTSVTVEEKQEIPGAKGVNAPNGIKEKLNDKSGSMSEQSKTSKEQAGNQVDVQHDGSSQKESNKTLDRINLRVSVAERDDP
ncbi:hypothetical protein L484_001718 [Morus notabilis]|uniref:AT3G52170-like helix-turn-helix domain-containing protein n=1 Tax=Morus notabilis TaxID=981085 RepID=W9RVD9_9ROSA|nr:hypothetical protein L484_001718 [Morus notabilis]